MDEAHTLVLLPYLPASNTLLAGSSYLPSAQADIFHFLKSPRRKFWKCRVRAAAAARSLRRAVAAGAPNR